MRIPQCDNYDTAPNPERVRRPRVVASVVDMVIPGITGAYARRFIVDRRGSEAVWLRPLAGPPGARLMLPRATFDALVDGGGA
ncbi:MAG: hypothetical protein HZA68_13095 [Rhodovulum sp.]|nr:hypothetical protein [Rhodovulum sp.]